MDQSPTSPSRLQLFNVADGDGLVRVLRETGRQQGVTFAAPRSFGPERCGRPARSLPDACSPSGAPAAQGAAAVPGSDAAAPGAVAAAPGDGTVPDRRAARPDRRPQAAKAPVPVWRWDATDRDLLKCARQVLNETVYPLAAAGRPFCLAWPFDESFLTPRRLTVADRRLLDLEDIGVLAGGAQRIRLAPAGQAADLLEDLDPDQRAAAAHGDGPARVLAAAGSGKTKTMVARVAALVRRGVPPQAILVLAFNTEAAVQLEERLAALGIPTTRKIAPASGGVHCATFNAFGQRFQRFVLGGAPAVRVDPTARQRLLRASLRAETAEEAVLDPYDRLLTDASVRLDRALSGWRTEFTTPADRIAAATRRYDELQATRGEQGFDDQVLSAVCALLSEPEHRRLVQTLYRYVLVDEFQDVNLVQSALLDIVSRPWRNLFVVGDDDQLIYGWRAARIGTIIDFGAGLPGPPFAAAHTLPTNYRCSHEIVGRAEQLVLNNRRRAQKSIRARDAAPAGAVLFAAGATFRERMLEVAAFLAVEQARRHCDWHELAVLCRYREQLTRVARALSELWVPAAAPAPAAALDATWAARLAAELRAAVAEQPAGRPATPAAALAVIDRIASRHAGAVADAGGRAVFEAARLLACDHPDPAGLADAWSRFICRPAGAGATGPAVTLATIHATKGREYASAAIVDFAPSLDPLPDEEREEERRVLYVGLTRARVAALLTVDTTRAPHPFIAECACAPQRTERRALRRRSAELRRSLEVEQDRLHPALVALIGETESRRRLRAAVDPPVMPAPLADLAAEYLHVRSRLAEAALFAPQGIAGRLLAALARPTAASASPPAAPARPPAA